MIHGVGPEGLLFGIDPGRDPGLWIVHMDTRQWRGLIIRSWHDRPSLIVDAAVTVPANIPDGFGVEDGAVMQNTRALDVDHAAERCVGDGRYEDLLGRSARNRDSEN